MSAGTAAGSARAAPDVPALRPRTAVAWGGAILVAGLAAAWGAGGALLVLGPVVIGAALALLGSPLPFLWLLVATSGLGFGWLEGGFEVGGATINLNGLRWGLVILATAAVLVRVGLPRLPRHLRGYVAFLALAVAGAAWTPAPFEALKHVLQFAAPLLVVLVAIRALRSPGDVDRLRVAFWIALLLGAAVGLTLGVIGLGGGAPLDEGRLVHRATGPFLLPILALALAAWRYRGGAWLPVAGAVFVLGLLTLSRATVAVMLVLVLLSTWGRPIRWYVGVALAVGLAGALALQYEPFRERVLGEDTGRPAGAPVVSIEGQGERAELVVGGVPLSGRGLVWLRTFRHALEAPVLGHGTGSSVHYLTTEVAVGVIHPHNDYLRVFHDLGLVGLLVLGAAAWMIARHMLRRHRDAPPGRDREAALAAALAFAGYLGIMVFDNALLYPLWLTQNVFLLDLMADGPGTTGVAPART